MRRAMHRSFGKYGIILERHLCCKLEGQPRGRSAENSVKSTGTVGSCEYLTCVPAGSVNERRSAQTQSLPSPFRKSYHQ